MGSEARARLGLWGLLAVALISFNQLFATDGFLGPALLGMLLSTGVSVGLRRLGLGTVTTIGLSLIVMVWYLGLVFQAPRTFWSLPTPDALVAIYRSVSRAIQQSEIDYAPVPLRTGYAVMVVGSMWIATTIGEIATFRWRRPLTASLLPIVAFAVAITTGTGTAAPLLVGLFLTSLLTYWGLESSHRMRSWGRWVSAWAHQKEAEPDAITGELARRIGATAVIFAMVSPLFLPALEDGLLSWRSGIGPSIGQGDGEGGGEGRLNPWVSIVPDIPNQTEEVLFAMEAGLSAYWRIASLEEFDGQNWTEFNDARFDSEQGEIEGQPVPLTISRQITQIIRIEGLRGEFLPAAIKPIAAQRMDVDPSAATEGIDFDPDSGSILVDDDLDEGHTYRITSTIPNVDFEDLVEARPPLPEDINEVYLEGTDLSQDAEDLYLGWISDADAVTPFEKLTAVQEGIRGFDYDLEAPPLEGDDYVSDFLTRTQTGFCQQFATAFAAIARDLGYPSRVSVGFLPGERAELEGAWIVRGTDAHAWPEVFFENFGWIAFEPTPRNESAPPDYTLRPLTEGGNGSGEEFNPQNPFSDPGTGGAANPEVGGQGGEALDVVGGGEGVEPPSLRGEELFQAGPGPRGTPAWQRTFTRLVTVVAIAFLLFLLSVPAIKEWRIRRRYREASTPDALAAAAFVQFEDEAAELAEARAPWESALSYATRMAADQHVAERSALRLARIYEAAAYAANDISREQAQEARKLAQALRSQLWHQAGWWTKLGRLFSPRRLRQV